MGKALLICESLGYNKSVTGPTCTICCLCASESLENPKVGSQYWMRLERKHLCRGSPSSRAFGGVAMGPFAEGCPWDHNTVTEAEDRGKFE